MTTPWNGPTGPSDPLGQDGVRPVPPGQAGPAGWQPALCSYLPTDGEDATFPLKVQVQGEIWVVCGYSSDGGELTAVSTPWGPQRPPASRPTPPRSRLPPTEVFPAVLPPAPPTSRYRAFPRLPAPPVIQRPPAARPGYLQAVPPPARPAYIGPPGHPAYGIPPHPVAAGWRPPTPVAAGWRPPTQQLPARHVPVNHGGTRPRWPGSCWWPLRWSAR